MRTAAATQRIQVARALAQSLLEELPERWAHTVGVTQRADELASTVPAAERELLMVAAWLHDVGYSPALTDTGFHPLDGASYLRRQGWPPRICGLVAHHSGAMLLARARGLASALAEYPAEESALSDALTYADQTVGPDGQRMSLDERFAEAIARRGADSAHARVRGIREPYLRAIAERVEQRRTAER